MPGFIDVTGWTNEQVRRLGHMDDDYEPTHNPYAYRKPIAKEPTFSYESDRVWGAAAIAFHTNNGYFKELPIDGTVTKTNRQIVQEILRNNEPISDDFIEEGRKVRRYFQALTFKVIEGRTLNSFLQSAMELAGKDTFDTTRGISIIASLPASYKKMSGRDSVDNRIKWARGGFIGQPGDKSKQNIEIIKALWSQNFNTWYYTGINDKDQVLFFAHKGTLEIGVHVTIEGKVKSHRETSTQFSHVRIIK